MYHKQPATERANIIFAFRTDFPLALPKWGLQWETPVQPPRTIDRPQPELPKPFGGFLICLSFSLIIVRMPFPARCFGAGRRGRLLWICGECPDAGPRDDGGSSYVRDDFPAMPGVQRTNQGTVAVAGAVALLPGLRQTAPRSLRIAAGRRTRARG